MSADYDCTDDDQKVGVCISHIFKLPAKWFLLNKL